MSAARVASGRKQTYEAGWYQDAVIYQLHVKAFFDGNNDGVGDFEGLTSRLDYLQDLGVDTLWLQPFYPSPLRDDGYDVSNYRGIHPLYGTMRDFRRFVRAAHRRSLRVVTELIVNHTSDQHPWFARARNAPKGSAHRDFYVWSDDDARYAGTRIIFTDTETSNWTWDPVAQQYYWHRFFSHQPDLNFENPRVVEALVDVMRFWFNNGVDGMRLDAVPYLCEREGTSNENLPETHAVIRQFRAIVDAEYPGRFLLAEANQWPEDARAYFGAGDECHMAFNFPLMPRMFISIAAEDRYPIYDIVRQTPPIPETGQWAIFLRNHDEMTLEMVSDRERAFMYSVYAPDAQARVNVGIRRRLAPLMENDRRRIELMASLLFSMPGTPVMYYGDEIGMGDNIYLGDRNGMRTPMQWSVDRNGGFSRADVQRLYLPVIQDPVYGYGSVNVEAQARSASSLYNWMKRLIAVRKAHRVFGRGAMTLLYPENRKVLAYVREFEGEVMLCVCNLSRSPQAVQLDLSRFAGRVPVEVIGWSAFPPIVDDRYVLTLPGHAFFWFLLSEHAISPAWQQAQPLVPELYTLVLPAGWRSLAHDPAKATFERDVIPAYVPKQRWFASKDATLVASRLLDWAVLGSDVQAPLLALAALALNDGVRESYLVAASIALDDGSDRPVAARNAFARCRIASREGWVYDAASESRLWAALVDAMRAGSDLRTLQGRIACRATEHLARVAPERSDDVHRLQTEQSNTSAIVGGTVMFKLYRRLQRGVHPEIEMARFLLGCGYKSTPKLLGTVVYEDRDDTTALAVAHEYVLNQGDGWTVTLNFLEQFLQRLREAPIPNAPLEKERARPLDPLAVYDHYARILGRRLAEMHRVLDAADDPAFAPEEASRDEILSWGEDVRRGVCDALDALERSLGALEGVRDEATALLARREALMLRIHELTDRVAPTRKTRIHGDFHMGQVLVIDNDILIVDLEGETRLPFEQRRRKQPQLRDVAGMLRSFDYAAVVSLLGLALDRTEEMSRFEPEIERWKRRAVDAFLARYQSVRGVPIDRALLEFFVISKAAYELRYELGNRPSWTRIPIRGLRGIVDAPAAGVRRANA